MFILLFLTFYLYAQEDPKLSSKRDEQKKAYLQKRMESIKKKLSYEIDKSHYSKNQQKAPNSKQLIKKCIEDISKSNPKSFIDKVKSCDDKYDFLRAHRSNSSIESLGISRTEHYKNVNNAIKQKLDAETKSLTKDDEVTISNFPYLFEAHTEIEAQIDRPGLDEVENKISQFKTIFIHLNKSKNIKEASRNLESEDLKYELTKLIYALETKENKRKCSDPFESFTLTQGEKREILVNRLIVKNDLSLTNLLAMYLPNSKLKKIEAFKIRQDGVDYLLFRDKNELNNSWLLSYKDKDGNDLYRKFHIIQTEKQKQREARDSKRKKYLSLVNLKDYHKKIIKTDDREVDLDLNLGLDVKFRNENIPLVGRKFIPTDDISIGSVGLTTKGKSLNSNSNVNLDSDEVRLQTQLIALKETPISLDAGIRYKLFENRWSQYSSVKGYNMMIHYSTDNNSNQLLGAEYYLKNNYIGYNTDLKNRKEFIIGRKFKNNKGGIHTSTEISGQFRQNITLLLILD